MSLLSSIKDLQREKFEVDWHDSSRIHNFDLALDVAAMLRKEDKFEDIGYRGKAIRFLQMIAVNLNCRLITKIEDCPICHGEGSTTDHHDPCTECGGKGWIG